MVCAQATHQWNYKLEFETDHPGKNYALNLAYDKNKGYDLLRKNGLEELYRPFDFMLSNQHHLDGKSTLTQMGFDYALGELTRMIPDARWRSFAVDAIRFGLEVRGESLNSRTFTRGKRTLEFKIDF
jgi:hypothetical protein